MSQEITWVVVWSDGTARQYCIYDKLGMTNFVKRGLKLGKVMINDREVVMNEEYWQYKDE
jgi:hypothetical protein